MDQQTGQAIGQAPNPATNPATNQAINLAGSDILDVLIVGSGIAARCAAAAISQINSSLTLAAVALPPASDAMSVMLVSPPSRQLLQNIGCWSSQSAAQQIETLHVSEQGRLGATRFAGADLGAATLGAAVATEALAAQLPKIDNTVTCSAVLGLVSDDEKATVHVVDATAAERAIEARLVLVADEGVVAIESLQKTAKNVAECAVSFSADMADEHHQVAYQRYVENGKITALPAGESREVTIIAEGALAAALADANDEQASCQLQNYFGYRLGRIQSLSEKSTTLLSGEKPVVHASRVIELGSPGMAAPFSVGNLHGCCYAIAALAELLGSEGSNSATVGRQLAVQLENYQPITAGLDRLFAAELGPLNHLRGAGLMALELVTPLRQQLVKRQLGQKSPLPPLMRPEAGL